MGDWQYYVATMRLSDVAARVRMAADIHESNSLKELIQRTLEKRASEIARYLLVQKQRLFNALVIGVYGGDPEWYDLRVRDNPHLRPEEIPGYVMDSLGILTLSGSEQLFALDGQHRVEGIRQAVMQRPSLGEEEVTTLFVSHRRTADGLLRTRRLFTTLNRYAKPVTKRDAIALDEDDAVAILTRKLIDEYSLFAGEKTSTKHTQALPVSASDKFTTIVALYNALDLYLGALDGRSKREWSRFKRERPNDDRLDQLGNMAVRLWDELRRRIPALEEMAANPSGALIGKRYRSKLGGHLLFRPIGLTAFAQALGRALRSGVSQGAAISRMASAPMDLASTPWRGLLWNPDTHRMITAGENKRVAVWILAYGAGATFTPKELRRVRSEWVAATGRASNDLRLVRFRHAAPTRVVRGRQAARARR